MTARQQARKIALSRLATTARNDAHQCDDDALSPGDERLAGAVRAALIDIANQLRRRADRIT